MDNQIQQLLQALDGLKDLVNNYKDIIEKKNEIIKGQQDLIDELRGKNRDIEEKIVVPESQRSIGRIPWEIRKVRLEEQHRASKVKETVQLHESSDEWSDNGLGSSE